MLPEDRFFLICPVHTDMQTQTGSLAEGFDFTLGSLAEGLWFLCKKVTPNPQTLKLNLLHYSRVEGMRHLVTIYSIFHHTLTYMDAIP